MRLDHVLKACRRLLLIELEMIKERIDIRLLTEISTIIQIKMGS